jgi:NAD(P)-dependent dehydrogenase (short-subunit alcohol dehydrogenase family)
MSEDITGQVVLITGASTGFGFRMAKRFAAAGAHVFATMREKDGRNAEHAEALERFATEGGLHLSTLELDVTSDGSVSTAVDQALSEAGRLDVLVNNAGVWGPGVLEAYSLDDWRRLFEVNLFGALRATRACLPAMREQGRGLVVAISSLQARFILPYSGPYVASKWALEGAMEIFRYETAPFGVECVIVEPYDFMTEMKDKAGAWRASDRLIEAAYGPANYVIDEFYMKPDPTRAGDPELVVDAVEAVLRTPHGSRPARVTVSNPMPQIDEINRLEAEMQAGLLPQMGLGHLLTVSQGKGGA